MQQEAIDIRATLLRAVELREAGRSAEAAELCARVVAAAPRHEGARYLQGVLALGEGRLDDAEVALREALVLAPALTGAHLNLGLTLRRLGRPDEAVASYDRALGLDPGSAETHNCRGVALLDLKRAAEALASFDAALGVDANFAAAHGNRGLALIELERPAEGLESLDAAIALAPDNSAWRHHRGNALMALDRAEAAVGSYDAALAAEPDHVEALANRGAALLALGRPHEALASCEAAIALRPDDPMLWFGRANVLAILGRTEEAIEAFDRVAAARPDFREAVYNRSLARLSLGQFREGWRDYEARWDTPHFLRHSSTAIPPALRTRLDPAADAGDLAGRRVLVVGEQGVGDVIMFASVLPDLMAIAGKVTLVCEPRLRGLLSHSFPQIEVRAPSDVDPGDYDHVLALGSLGRLFRNRAEDFPGAPYLAAGAAVRTGWAERLAPRAGRLRIGLSWRGGLARTRRDERSLPLSGLRPILDLADCDFVSLQYGDVAAEIEAENARRSRPILRFPPNEIDDFEPLGGLIQALDLVVSVQTTVVHLAGALGVPCLTMTPSQPEWRYAAAAPDLLWYGAVKVFRQASAGDWSSVLEPVAQAVRERLAEL